MSKLGLPVNHSGQNVIQPRNNVESLSSWGQFLQTYLYQKINDQWSTTEPSFSFLAIYAAKWNLGKVWLEQILASSLSGWPCSVVQFVMRTVCTCLYAIFHCNILYWKAAACVSQLDPLNLIVLFYCCGIIWLKSQIASLSCNMLHICFFSL